MKIEINANNDAFFTLIDSSDVDVPDYEERTDPVIIEEVAPAPPSVPLENPKETNSFNIFAGTSWGSDIQGPGTIK